MRRIVAAVLVAMMAGGPLGMPMAAAQAQQSNGTMTIRADVNRVLTDVTVVDKKTGAVIKGLQQSDFQIFEDKKQQKITGFVFQDMDQAVALQEAGTASGATSTKKKSIADMVNNDFAAKPEELKDRRLMILFFDLSSMQPEDVERAVDSARNYVNKQMAPADMVAMISLVSGLTMDQDFTNDKPALLAALEKYDPTAGGGYVSGSEGGGSDGSADDSSSFVADDSEFNALNTDRQIYALRTICKAVEKVDQKKSIIYFSGGLTRQGIENQASIRAAGNECVKADTTINAVDSRGLEAINAVGNANSGSIRGTSAYSGASMVSALQSNFNSQETLGTMAADTGGRLFTDSNDFSGDFTQVQKDTQAFYRIEYKSSNTREDGTYRHLTINLLNHPEAKLEYRPGYYAQADFTHSNTEDRGMALMEQMRSDVPATDVQVFLQALYFKLADGKFYIPISVVIPGSQINAATTKDKTKANIDFLGQVKDAQGILVGQVQQTVNLQLDANQQIQKKNVQYSTGFMLAPGRYHVKFVVRENQSGNMGSFETDIQVPDMSKMKPNQLKLSSVVMSSQQQPDKEKKPIDPLVRDGVMWVPNVAHVFRQDQHLYFLYEVYSPAKDTPAGTPAAAPNSTPAKPDPNAPVHVLTSIEFMLGGVKVYETPMVEATAINIPERSAVGFQFDVPLAGLKPGTYVCQVNVIDDAGGSWSFPRMALRVTPPAAAPAAAPQPVASAGSAKTAPGM